MCQSIKLAIILLLVHTSTWGQEYDQQDANNYEFNFGLVLHNDSGEPVGFKKTENIPIINAGKTSLYGLVVTGIKDEHFTLSSIHVMPKKNTQQNKQKVMGKAMMIEKRGAIFMRTDFSDKPGIYQMEIYINNVLLKTIEYQLINIEMAELR